MGRLQLLRPSKTAPLSSSVARFEYDRNNLAPVPGFIMAEREGFEPDLAPCRISEIDLVEHRLSLGVHCLSGVSVSGEAARRWLEPVTSHSCYQS
jgi:hypothetical protein